MSIGEFNCWSECNANRHNLEILDTRQSDLFSRNLMWDTKILSRVRGSVTNNNGFWIGSLDLLVLRLQLHLITITYNSSQSVTT
jgi:hypothetical protein